MEMKTSHLPREEDLQLTANEMIAVKISRYGTHESLLWLLRPAFQGVVELFVLRPVDLGLRPAHPRTRSVYCYNGGYHLNLGWLV